MIPQSIRPLFWDINAEQFDPGAHPEYAIYRVLELGDREAMAWLRQTFSEQQILGVLRRERRLSRKSANFWALLYGVPHHQVAALQWNGIGKS